MPKRRVIIIVEDDPQVLAIIQRSLTMGGFQTLCYSSAEEVMVDSSWVGAPIAVIDYGLPVADGEVLGEAMQQTDPNLKVIYITGGDVNSLPEPRLHKLNLDGLLPMIGGMTGNGS